MLNEPTPDELRKATHEGAKLLDKMVPGWYRRMRPEKLVMSSPTLCALGQLFGRDVELSVAKQMFPEQWANASNIDGPTGYGIGKLMTRQWAKNCGDAEAATELAFLHTACAGWNTKCFWAEEVADRLAKDEEVTDV